MQGRKTMSPWGLVTAMAVTVIPVAHMQAGNLDRALMQNTGKLIEYLDESKVKNVAVLPFQVKKGERKASYDAAPLAQNLPTRIENSLIMALDSDSFGVVRNAIGTVARAKVGNYMTSKAAFDKLFQLTYTRAWDGAPVRVDTFLTGKVVNATNQRDTTEVIIAGFDRNSWKDGKILIRKIHSFKVKTDRYLLADQGYNFALTRSTLTNTKLTSRQRNNLAVKLVARDEGDEEADQKQQPGQSQARTPNNAAGFVFEVRYDGVTQTIKKIQQSQKGQQAPEYEVPPAPLGSKITLHLKRVAQGDATLGVVLKVNGMSTWDKETVDSSACRRWIYKPASVGREDVYEGFYLAPDGAQCLRFKTLKREDADEAMSQMGARAGWIDVDIFGSKGQQQRTDIENGKDNTQGGKQGDKQGDKEDIKDDDLLVTRGLPRVQKKRKFSEYQTALLAANNQKRKKKLGTRGDALIYHETEAVPAAAATEAALPNPELIGHISIRYWSDRGSSSSSSGKQGGTQQQPPPPPQP